MVNLTKRSLVQAQEDIRESNEMMVILNSYLDTVNEGWELRLDMEDNRLVRLPTRLLEKPYMIEIDVTKLP